ncbi:MAG: restriction endonuclease subunit S [Candidatus Obscuribacterales bacterium]|nr:restriction endonuclease subunit S [Candidatus Obscuribacterales bacterium]
MHNSKNHIIESGLRDWKPRGVRHKVASESLLQLSSIPEDWRWVYLGQVAALQPGYAFKSSMFVDDGIKLLRGTNIIPGDTRWEDTVHLDQRSAENYSDYLLNDGDIVIAMDRPLISSGLKVAQLTSKDLPSLLLQRVGRFKLECAIDRDFLFFFLKSNLFIEHITALATGTQLPHISQNDIESARIPLPPISIQTKIVEKLQLLTYRLNNIRDSLNLTLTAVSQYRRAVIAKEIVGNSNATFTSLSAQTKWPLFKLGQLIERPKYGTSKKCHSEVHGIAVLRIPNLVNGRIDHSDLKYTDLTEAEAQDLSLTFGDILIIRSNGSLSLVGNSAVVEKSDEHCSFAGYLIRLRPLRDKLDPKYLNYCLKSQFIREQIESAAKSTSGVNNINSEEIKGLHIPVPPIEIQLQIVESLDKKLTVADSVESQCSLALQRLLNLENAILRKAFFGQLDIPAAKTGTTSLVSV